MVFNIRLSVVNGLWSWEKTCTRPLASSIRMMSVSSIFALDRPFPFFAILLYDSTMYLVCRLSTRSAKSIDRLHGTKSLFLSFG